MSQRNARDNNTGIKQLKNVEIKTLNKNRDISTKM